MMNFKGKNILVVGGSSCIGLSLVMLKVVNVIGPSFTDTPLAQRILSTTERKETAGKRHSLGRYGLPEDISSAIAFLLADESSWMNVQIIGVDGGLVELKID